MARLIFDFETKTWIDKDDYVKPVKECHSIIQDSTSPFVSHADGKVYDSKSAYRKDLKARGLREVGNDKLDSSKDRYQKGDLKGDIARSINQLIYKN